MAERFQNQLLKIKICVVLRTYYVFEKYQSFHIYFFTPPMKIPQPLLPIEVAFTALAWFFPFMFCYHVKSNSSHRLELAITHRTQVHFYLLFLKVEKILKRSLDSIPSPSPSVKIKITWGVKAKHCWALSTNFWKWKVENSNVFALSPQVNFPANNLDFRQRWWYRIQAIFLNRFILHYHGFEVLAGANSVRKMVRYSDWIS